MKSFPDNSRMEHRASILVLIAVTMWGIDSFLLRPSLYTLPVTLIVFLESTFVTILLTPFYIRRIREVQYFSGTEWLAFTGVAVFGVIIGTMAITRALF